MISTTMNWIRGLRSAAAILVFCTLLGCQQIAASRVTLDQNGYQNILVAISPSAYQNGIKDGLKTLLSATSTILMEATGNRTYFNSISILPPKEGTNYNNLHRKRRDTWDGAYPSFETADIRVDTTNAAYGNYPFTQQSRGCGEPGDFILLSPDFILRPDKTNGPPEKLLANEWIKYRYGVFDENGYYGSTTLYPQKYYDAQNTLTDNVCSNTTVIWKEHSCKVSQSSNGVGPSECTLTPDPDMNNDVNSSMMSLPLTNVATEYCNESSHNHEAPSKHNILCGGKSIMEVVLNHPDFASNANTPNYGNFKAITFNDIAAPAANLALVILWEPMEQTLAQYSARSSIVKFISKDFPNNSYFGMIQATENDTAPLIQLTPVTQDRSYMAAQVKQVAFSSSRTGHFQTAFTSAVTMLKSESVTTFPKAVIVMSNYASPSDMNSICTSATNSGIQIHLLTYNQTVAQSFQNTPGCPGQVYLIQGKKPNTTLSSEEQQCYTDLQNRALLDNTFMNLPSIVAPDAFLSPLIFHEAVYMNATNGTFLVDTPISSVDAYFYIEGCMNYGPPLDTLYPFRWLGDPSNAVPYDESTAAFFELQTLNKSGVWDFGVVPQQTGEIIPYVVYAMGRTKVDTSGATPQSIQATAWTVVDTDVNSEGASFPRVRIFTSVTFGTSPVFNAKVDAKINDDSGNPFNITLYDDGSGNPDITSQDGIYSAYFTQLKPSAATTYTIVINVTDNDGAATYPTTQYEWISQRTMGIEKTDTFKRTAQPSSFTATGQTGDPTPPGQMTDFQVRSISGTQVIYQWTAPGGDYDFGTANEYLMRCSINRTMLEGVTKLDTATSATTTHTPTPKISKTVQTATITGTVDQLTHYCAIQAKDKTNYGPVSPIRSYYITGATGLSTGSIAGIVVGVILGLILLIAIVVLVWWCCARDDDQKNTTAAGKPPQSKLIPIIATSVEVQGGLNSSKHSLNDESYQNRPQSVHSKTHSQVSGSHFDGDDSSGDENASNYNRPGLVTFHGNRSPSPRVTVEIPLHPLPNSHGMLGSSPPVNDYDSTFIMQNADVAIPQRLVKLAVIEDVGEYSDAQLQGPRPNENIQDYKNMPVYTHLLSKQPPPPPLRGPGSLSSSTHSLNTTGRQTPANNTQV